MTLLEQIQNSFWSVSRLIFSIPGPEYCFHFSEFQTCFFFFFLQQRCECKYVCFFCPWEGQVYRQTVCVFVFVCFWGGGLGGRNVSVPLWTIWGLFWVRPRRYRGSCDGERGKAESRSLRVSLTVTGTTRPAPISFYACFFFRATTTTCDLSVYVVMSDWISSSLRHLSWKLFFWFDLHCALILLNWTRLSMSLVRPSFCFCFFI